MRVLLVLNSGSSSLKFQVFDADTLAVVATGKVAGIGGAARLTARFPAGGASVDELLARHDHDGALQAVLGLIDAHDDGWTPVATMHRVVHGGPAFRAPVFVTPEVMAQLQALAPLAPLHQPFNLAGIAAADRLIAGVPDIACFDTAFHAGHGELQHTFALEVGLRERGVRRYGFHGLSYEWIACRLAAEHPALAAGRVVVAHLGNGASLCALQAGISVDTTMGMTALDGLPMGTRCGALDAGAVTYMIRALGMDVDEVEHALYERSGLQGLSGISNDVQTLLASEDPRAAFALTYFAHKVAQQVAQMAVSLGGLDGLVFTAGIGENAGSLRDAVLGRLEFLGSFEALVIPANEERMMAVHAQRLLQTLAS
ncbi:acetate/propionate family kinase [Roseateles sp. DC23W]|uniref:Acetate kinase n=1 Tax=Pelomonas dachongensis TaxID=3299029 RepID=A0ABW7EV47_9BURK